MLLLFACLVYSFCITFLDKVGLLSVCSFMNIGPTRPLELDDISKMMPTDQPEICIPKFQKTWKLEKERLEAKTK